MGSLMLLTNSGFAQASAPAATLEAVLVPRPDCRPLYPKAALRSQAQGVSRLAFHVDETGKVTSAEVVQSAGPTREHRLLDMAAIEALMRCPLKVGHDDMGKPVASVLVVNYTWRLE